MRKGNKCTLGTILKSNAPILTEPPDEAIFILGGGHLIHIVPWPSDGTYHDVCLAYVSYIEEHYDHHVTVVFDGYDSSNSTKGFEQRRRAAQATSGGILFELDMKANTPKKFFLANSKNKSRLISRLMAELDEVGISCKQHKADADHLIVSTAITIATTTTKPVVVVGTNTDLLVMLVVLSPPELDTGMYMLCQCNPMVIYSIPEIQSLQAQLKPHLLALHALTGCETVSAPYMRGKKAVAVLKTLGHSYLEAFTKGTSTHDEVARAGEVFLLKLYGAGQQPDLDKCHFIMYNKLISKSSLATGLVRNTVPNQGCLKVSCISSLPHCSTVAMQWTVSVWMGLARQGWVTGSCRDWQSCRTR